MDRTDLEAFIPNFFKEPQPEAKQLWAKVFRSMTVHTRGDFPLELINNRRPYEQPEIQKYRKANYEPITMDAINRALTNLQRIFASSAVSLSLPQDLEAYIQEPNFDGTPLPAFINRRVVRRMIEDPNGVLIWWPTGDGVERAGEKVDVTPMLVPSTKIRHDLPDLFSFIAPEKSPVTVTTPQGSKVVHEGHVYYIATTEAYYKFVQFGERSKRNFRLDDWYEHGLGEMPLVKLGGEEAQLLDKHGEETVYLQSYFSAFVPFANEAIRQFSDHQAVMVINGHPIRVMESQPCPNTLCHKGYIRTTEDGGHVVTEDCPDCHGQGVVAPSGPYGVFFAPKDTGIMGQEGATPKKAIEYITAPVDILKYAGEHWQALIQRGEKALNLLFIDEAQSGTAKAIDREDKISMLDKIGGHVFEGIFAKSLRIIYQLREITGDPNEIQINLPSTFRERSEAELALEVVSLAEKKITGIAAAETMNEYIRKRFSGNTLVLRTNDLLMMVDPLYGEAEDAKVLQLAAGVIDEAIYQTSLLANRAAHMVYLTDKERYFDDDANAATIASILATIDTLRPPPPPTPPPPPISA